MKKVFFSFAVATMIASLMACGNTSSQNTDGQDSTAVEAGVEGYDQEGARAALVALYEGTTEKVNNAKSKEELLNICKEYPDAIDAYDTQYLGFVPKADDVQTFFELGKTLGNAIVTTGRDLGMSMEEIEECTSYITGE